ncbi:MAG TPA: ABC transporter ATP-binding protein [Actinomycetota bacterium]|nr:ABC transporter ATP-binding protein [Actinomycetota bacterium]
MEQPAPADDAITTSGLTKTYGTVTAVAGLTMSVPRGEVFGFLGPNGAGKTTSVKLLLGLARPSGGEAWVLGAQAGDTATRRRIGYLPELFRYPAWLSAYEVLRLHCELAKLPRARWQGEIERALVTVGLAERAHSRVATFSKGMQQRLGLGVALLGDPEVIFLDEPTSALDPVGRRDVRDVIRHLKERGVTVFLNSHLLSEVEQVCDRVAVVHHGTVIASGPLATLLAGAGVRIRVAGLDRPGVERLARFGTLDAGSAVFDHEPIWIAIGGVGPDVVPEVVAEIVAGGGRVYAVEPRHQSLEERFMELLGGER